MKKCTLIWVPRNSSPGKIICVGTQWSAHSVSGLFPEHLTKNKGNIMKTSIIITLVALASLIASFLCIISIFLVHCIIYSEFCKEDKAIANLRTQYVWLDDSNAQNLTLDVDKKNQLIEDMQQLNDFWPISIVIPDEWDRIKKIRRGP